MGCKMKACITVKLPNGGYKNISSEDIEQVFINTNGEKVVFWKDGYGVEIDNHTLSANTFVNNKLSTKEVK